MSSYVACLFLVIIGMPPVTNSPAPVQATGYILALIALVLVNKSKNVGVRHALGAVYGFIAMITFAGGVQWVGGLAANLSMALWDLGLGVTMLMGFENG